MNSTDYTLMMRKAKIALSNNWMPAVVGTLIVYLLLALAGSTYIGALLLYGPLVFGYIIFMQCLIDTKRTDYNLLFVGFNRFVELMIAGALFSLAVSIGVALLIVPGIILQLGFGMTFFIMAEDKNITGIDALQQSWTMMRGHKWELFCLNIRFIGWALLCILTCGIGYLWLAPYMLGANLNFYRRLKYGTI